MLNFLLLIAGCTGAPGVGPGHDDTALPPHGDAGTDTDVDTPPEAPRDDCTLDPTTGPGLTDTLTWWRESNFQWMTCGMSVTRCLDAAGESFVCILQSQGEGTVTTCYRESDGAPVYVTIMSDVAEYCNGTSYRLSGGEAPVCMTRMDSADLDVCPPLCGAEITWEAVPVPPQCADGPRGDAFVEPELADRRGPPPLCVPLVWQIGASEACVAVEDGQLVAVGPDGAVTTLGVAVAPGSVAVDVDGDGALDLASPAANGVYVARGGAAPEAWVIGAAVSRVDLAGDVDGDGRMDLLAYAAHQRTIIVPANTPFRAMLQSLPVLTGDLRPFGDLDGDGADEVASESAGVTTVYSQPGLPGAATWSGPAALRPVGDVDGDGAPDLMSVDGVLFGPPSGALLGALPGRPAQAVADVDGDGQVDLILSEPGLDRRACATDVWEPLPLTRPTTVLSWVRGPVARSPSPSEVVLGSVEAPIDDVADVRAERGGLIVQRGDWRVGDAWWWCPPR